jgi:hypothetical protein
MQVDPALPKKSSREHLHICPIGVAHEYRCTMPRICSRPERSICLHCLLNADPQRQQWIREYTEAWNDAARVAEKNLMTPSIGRIVHFEIE